MPQVIDQSDLDFLREVDRQYQEGKKLSEVAKALGVSPATITYRMRSAGLKPGGRLVDARTGRTFADLIDDGDLVARSCEPAGAAA